MELLRFLTFLSAFRAEVKGIMCNWLVCMAVWLCTMAKDRVFATSRRLDFQWSDSLIGTENNGSTIDDLLHSVWLHCHFH